MTRVIPQTVRSVLVIDFILTASEIFKIIGSATCFFNNSGKKKSYPSEVRAWWPVTFDVKRVKLSGFFGSGKLQRPLSLVSHGWSHWLRPCWPNSAKGAYGSKGTSLAQKKHSAVWWMVIISFEKPILFLSLDWFIWLVACTVDDVEYNIAD